MQLTSPSAEYHPALQLEQLDDCSRAACLPAGQSMHLLSPASPNLPAAHTEHKSEPAADALPPGHAEQIDAAGLENVPEGHSEQYVLWAADANVPLAHSVQPASPVVE